MTHGGQRPGSGRKPGSANKRTREIADRAVEDGVTPLEVMLRAMRKLLDDGQIKEAADIAAKAAPYVHPRLASVEMKGDVARVQYFVSDRPIDRNGERWLAEVADDHATFGQ